MQVAKGIEERDLVEALNRTISGERLQVLVDRYGLYAGQPDPVQSMRRDISVMVLSNRPHGSSSFQIGFRNGAPEIARRVASDLTETMLKEQTGLSVLDAPLLPRQPFYPNRVGISDTGLAAGAVLGLAAAFWRRTRTTTA